MIYHVMLRCIDTVLMKFLPTVVIIDCYITPGSGSQLFATLASRISGVARSEEQSESRKEAEVLHRSFH